MKLRLLMRKLALLPLTLLCSCHGLDRLLNKSEQQVTADQQTTKLKTLWIGVGQSNMDRMIRFGGGQAFQDTLGDGAVLMNCAISGSYLEQLKPNGSTFNTCMEMVNAYTVKYPTAAVAGIIYYQGESDAMGPGSADDPNMLVHTSDYATMLMSNFTGYRARIGDSHLPIVFAQIASCAKPYPYWTMIQEQQASIHDTNIVMITMLDLPLGDFIHLAIPGSTTEAGRRFGEAVLALLGRE